VAVLMRVRMLIRMMNPRRDSDRCGEITASM
jgi:hypothetical protein